MADYETEIVSGALGGLEAEVENLLSTYVCEVYIYRHVLALHVAELGFFDLEGVADPHFHLHS